MNVGARIKELRVSNMLSMKQLAEGSGVSQGFLSDVEAGSKSITINKLKKICDYLGVSLAEFFSAEKIEQPPINLRYACQRLQKLNEAELKTILSFIDLLDKARSLK